MRIFVMFAAFLFFALSASATEPTPTATEAEAAACAELELSGATSEQLAQQGCCSYHDGVCGCGVNGRVRCCDGTQSPSCRCATPDERAPTLQNEAAPTDGV